MRRLALALAALALSPDLAHAEAQTYRLDPDHTTILFEVNHFGFSQIFGAFALKEGTLVLDRANPAGSKVTAVIDATSLNTLHAARTAHVASADFLNTAQFPAITFTSTKVEQTGPTTAQVTGDLTLLGKSQPVSFAVTFRGEGPNPLNQTPTVGFAGSGSLQRSSWGLSTFLPAIADSVAFRIETEATPANP